MKKLLLLLLLPLLFMGCRSSKSIQNRFYMLELPASVLADMPNDIAPMRGSYHVQGVEVSPAYASYQIALREESHSIRYFSFSEWAQRPGVNFTQMADGFFGTHNVFEHMLTGRITEPADFVLSIQVHRMEVDHQGAGFKASLILEFLLTDALTGQVLHHHHANRSKDLPQRNLNLFAAAISELFAEELVGFTMQILGERPDHRRY